MPIRERLTERGEVLTGPLDTMLLKDLVELFDMPLIDDALDKATHDLLFRSIRSDMRSASRML
jgi:hypothetical protein